MGEFRFNDFFYTCPCVCVSVSLCLCVCVCLCMCMFLCGEFPFVATLFGWGEGEGSNVRPHALLRSAMLVLPRYVVEYAGASAGGTPVG